MRHQKEQRFEFHGVDSKLAIVGTLFFLITVVSGTVALMLLLENVFGITDSNLIKNRLAFSFVFTVFVGLIATRLYGKFVKKLWTIDINEETIQISFNNSLKTEFLLSDLQKIHVNGWYKKDNKSSYRWLRLLTDDKRLLIIVGNTGLINTSTPSEIAILDNFLSLLEAYALKKNFLKTDLKKGYHYSFGKNYYYSKNKNL